MASRSFPAAELRAFARVAGALLLLAVAGCHSPGPAPKPKRAAAPTPAVAGGDEIIVAGKRFHTGTRVVTWQEPGGYNGYLDPAAFGRRNLPGAQRGKPELAELQGLVDQFVLHYDACGLSRICFNVLRERHLSVHFLLDVDGTIYQTLDLAEKAAHATVVNNRSVGVEIANVGAYAPDDVRRLLEWYQADRDGRTRLAVPARIREPGILTPGFAGAPARSAPVRGQLNGAPLVQYDFTPQQYEALAHLIATLCRVFPKMACDYPHMAGGRLKTGKLTDRELTRFHGVLGHFHVQADKFDPGPALQWSRLIDDARRLRR